MAENLVPNSINAENRYPYASLAFLTFGKTFGQYVAFLLDLTVFSAGIPNLIVGKLPHPFPFPFFNFFFLILAAQTLQVLGLKATRYSYNLSYCYWILILGLIQVPLLWLGSPKDMKYLYIKNNVKNDMHRRIIILFFCWIIDV